LHDSAYEAGVNIHTFDLSAYIHNAKHVTGPAIVSKTMYNFTCNIYFSHLICIMSRADRREIEAMSPARTWDT
jgi:hypothetical protein